MKFLTVILAVAVFGQAFGRPNRDVEKLLNLLKKEWTDGTEKSIDSEESGSGAGAAGYDYAADVMAKCDGLDITAMYAEVGKPVDKPTLESLVGGVSELAQTYADMVGDHNTGMDEFEAALADPQVDLETYLTQHAELIAHFADGVTEMGEKGFCTFAKLGPLRYRMEIAGVTGFRTETKCNSAGIFVMAAYYKNDWDEEAAATDILGSLPEVGELLRADIRCLGNDVKDFRDFASIVKVNAEMSGRQAILTLDGLTGYMEDIGRDVMHLLETAHHLGELLDAVHEDKKVTERNLKLRSDLKKLIKSVEKMA